MLDHPENNHPDASLRDRVLLWAGANDVSGLSGTFGRAAALFGQIPCGPVSPTANDFARVAAPLFPHVSLAHFSALEFAFNSISNPVVLPDGVFPDRPADGMVNLLSGAFDLATIYGGTAITGDLRAELNRCLIWPWNAALLQLDGDMLSDHSDVLRLHNIIAQDGAFLDESWFARLPPLQKTLYFANGDLCLNRAILPDLRNDESLLQSQFHRALIHFHNLTANRLCQTTKAVDGPVLARTARDFVVRTFAEILLGDVLPGFIDPDILWWSVDHGAPLYARLARQQGVRQVLPLEACALLPLLLSLRTPAFLCPNAKAQVAGVALGPDDMSAQQRFAGLPGRLFLSPRMPTRVDPLYLMDWSLHCGAPRSAAPATNRPEFVADSAGIREALHLVQQAELVSGEICAGQAREFTGLDIPQVTATEVAGHFDSLPQRKGGNTPLVPYVLAEAALHGKQGRLGPLGSLIVAETFAGAIQSTMPDFTIRQNRDRGGPTLRDLLTATDGKTGTMH